MKRIILCLSTCVITVCSLAQNNSNITISTTGTSNLKIRFAGKQYSLQDRSVTFQSMEPGNYTLVIFQLQRKNNGDNEFTEVFNNTVTLTAQKHLEISVLRFGRVARDERYIEPDNWTDGSYHPAGNQGNNNHRRIVSDRLFTILKKTMISSTINGDNSKTVDSAILKNNLFTTMQIKELCLLSLEQDKRLAFAKLAYDYCVDQGNYLMLLDIFLYQSFKTDLLNFINDK